MQPAGSASSSSKVSIPRIERPREDQPAKTTSRAQTACLNCRNRKVKCDGGQPRCRNCTDNAGPCVYTQTRKDRLREANEQIQGMAELLRDLKDRASPAERERIDHALSAVSLPLQSSKQQPEVGSDGQGQGATKTSDTASVQSKRRRRSESYDPDAAEDSSGPRAPANFYPKRQGHEYIDILDEDLFPESLTSHIPPAQSFPFAQVNTPYFNEPQYGNEMAFTSPFMSDSSTHQQENTIRPGSDLMPPTRSTDMTSFWQQQPQFPHDSLRQTPLHSMNFQPDSFTNIVPEPISYQPAREPRPSPRQEDQQEPPQ